MINPLMRFISAVVAVALLGAPAAAAGERWLWVSPKEQVQARHLAMTVSPSEPGVEPAVFRCAIDSDFGYRGATVRLEVRDRRGERVSEGAFQMDISAGANECAITLDTAGLALGTYEAVFSITHTSLLSEPTQTFILRNVSTDDLEHRLSAVAARAGELRSALDALGDGGASYPYLQLKISIVDDVIAAARANTGHRAWESVEPDLRYAEVGLDAVHSAIVFGGTGTERNAAMPRRPLDELRIEDGGFVAGTAPVFLFGGALPSPDAGEIARLHRYQLNSATVGLQPTGNPERAETPDALAGQLAPLLDAARSHNISIAIQLSPQALSRAGAAAAPALGAGGPLDTGHPDLMAHWEAYLAGVGRLLQGPSMVLGVSLAENPRFYFDGPDVKAGFLEFVRANYTDRIALNRAWRSHLASLDDIEPRSQNPYDSYQRHRPYQYDWQTYHQQLGNDYLKWSRDVARRHLPGTPLMVTMPDTPFEPGEAAFGVDREELAEILQIAACSGVNTSADPVYGMGYPSLQAYYALLRSFAPDQPVFNVDNGWELPERGTPADTYRFVHTALWEGVMAGLSGATIPMDSLVFQRPAALEAFATAALDINRLAPIVRAFQTAPADVGILFSESSRVFDKGDPHLDSALHAYEGVSFGGYKARFITERQCQEGILDTVKIVVLPTTPAVSDEAFARLSEFVEAGGTIARTGAPIPYNERGVSRDDLIRNTGETVLVRGLNLPTEYLHAMDAATVLGALPQIPRTITPQGYPVEGVRSRYVEHEGDGYLYLVNLRKEPVYCTLATQTRQGRDLILGQDVTFPTTLEPLVPMLIKLKPVYLEMVVTTASG